MYAINIWTLMHFSWLCSVDALTSCSNLKRVVRHCGFIVIQKIVQCIDNVV
jgi:hypothetical protein